MIKFSGVVFKERIGGKSVDRNKVSRQRFFSFKYSLSALLCFSTDSYSSQREESRGPPWRTLSQP